MLPDAPPQLFRLRSTKSEFVWEERAQLFLFDKISFAKPDELHDPTELDPIITSDTEEAIIEALDSLRLQLLEFHSAKRDPFSSLVDVLSRDIDEGDVASGVVAKRIRQMLVTIFGSAKVSCLTEDITNVAFWSHFGDGHRGFAYGFDVDQSKTSLGTLLLPVRYTGRARISETAIIKLIQGFATVLSGPDIGARDEVNDILAALFATKLPEHSFEKEWRLVSTVDFRRYFRAEYLRFNAVYFGLKCSSSFEDKFLQRGLKGVSAYKMELENCNEKLTPRLLK